MTGPIVLLGLGWGGGGGGAGIGFGSGGQGQQTKRLRMDSQHDPRHAAIGKRVCYATEIWVITLQVTRSNLGYHFAGDAEYVGFVEDVDVRKCVDRGQSKAAIARTRIQSPSRRLRISLVASTKGYQSDPQTDPQIRTLPAP